MSNKYPIDTLNAIAKVFNENDNGSKYPIDALNKIAKSLDDTNKDFKYPADALAEIANDLPNAISGGGSSGGLDIEFNTGSLYYYGGQSALTNFTLVGDMKNTGRFICSVENSYQGDYYVFSIEGGFAQVVQSDDIITSDGDYNYIAYFSDWSQSFAVTQDQSHIYNFFRLSEYPKGKIYVANDIVVPDNGAKVTVSASNIKFYIEYTLDDGSVVYAEGNNEVFSSLYSDYGQIDIYGGTQNLHLRWSDNYEDFTLEVDSDRKGFTLTAGFKDAMWFNTDQRYIGNFGMYL